MKIYVEIGGRYKDNPRVERLFEKYEKRLQKTLGHASINTTLLYTHMNRFEDSAESAISKAF